MSGTRPSALAWVLGRVGPPLRWEQEGAAGNPPLATTYTGPLGWALSAGHLRPHRAASRGSWDISLPAPGLFSMAFLPPPQPFPVLKNPVTPVPKDHRSDRWPDRLGQGSQDRMELPDLTLYSPSSQEAHWLKERPGSIPHLSIAHGEPVFSSMKLGSSCPPLNNNSSL